MGSRQPCARSRILHAQPARAEGRQPADGRVTPNPFGALGERVIGRASDPATIRPSPENPSKNHDLVVPPPTPHVESAAGGALTSP
jgi:hypothetical protein